MSNKNKKYNRNKSSLPPHSLIQSLIKVHKPNFDLSNIELGGELLLLLGGEFIKNFLATGAALTIPGGLSMGKMAKNRDDFLELLNDLSLENWRKNRSLKQLQNNKLIKKRKNNFYLTKKGFQKSFFVLANNLAIKIPKKWDGKWRIVIFDLPKNYAGNRNFLRRRLIVLGFVQIQKSVWAFPFPCEKEVRFVIELSKAKRYTHFLIGSIDNDKEFIKIFAKIFPKQFQKYIKEKSF